MDRRRRCHGETPRRGAPAHDRGREGPPAQPSSCPSREDVEAPWPEGVPEIQVGSGVHLHHGHGRLDAGNVPFPGLAQAQRPTRTPDLAHGPPLPQTSRDRVSCPPLGFRVTETRVPLPTASRCGNSTSSCQARRSRVPVGPEPHVPGDCSREDPVDHLGGNGWKGRGLMGSPHRASAPMSRPPRAEPERGKDRNAHRRPRGPRTGPSRVQPPLPFERTRGARS